MIAQELVLLERELHVLSSKNAADDASQQCRDSLWQRAEFLLNRATELDLSMSKPKAALLSYEARNTSQVEALRSRSRDLLETMVHELHSVLFLPIRVSARDYLSDEQLFGNRVSSAFEDARYDIQEAGKCLALGRSTACVYHTMRVLEHGLCALADKFKIPFEHKSWNSVIEPIEKAIRDIKSGQRRKPKNWKANEQFYSEAATQFMHFKNAWRNYTAHKQFTYTEESAEAIFRHVRDFMKHISGKLGRNSPKDDPASIP